MMNERREPWWSKVLWWVFLAIVLAGLAAGFLYTVP